MAQTTSSEPTPVDQGPVPAGPVDPARAGSGRPGAAADRQVPTRRLSLESSLARVPRHFAKDGDLVSSHFIAALSALFPDGEDFFVRSVRRFRDQVTDGALKRQVNGFIGQEAMHGREHRVMNRRLSELGYPTRAVEKFTKKGLETRERLMSDRSNLAATAALEHFTATLAELVLSNEEIRDAFGHQGVRELFLWHALEESEHKAVAFDVYRAVGGSERTRRITMKVLRYTFVAVVTGQLAVSLLLDPATYRPGRLLRSLAQFRRTPLIDKEIWRQLKEYERPDFHPDQRDTTALIEHWRHELFGPEGTLNDRLAGSAA